MPDVVVVGAGMAGLTAAKQLDAAGRSVVVVDKGRAVGGRMATRRNEGARYDHGAQRFSARSAEFNAAVDTWIEAHVVRSWFVQERIVRGETVADRRLVGVNGMRGICEYLARDLDVRTGTVVSSVAVEHGKAVAHTDAGPLVAAAAIVTAPTPQLLAMVDLDDDPALRSELEGVRYNPCLAVMAQVQDSRAMHNGYMTPDSRTIAWIADNQHKGVSATPAVTIHATPGFSETHLEEEPSEWVPFVVREATDVLATSLSNVRGHRWRYSEPQTTLGTSYAVLAGPAPIVLAGEAFVSPRVEGAYLSGAAAARALLS